MTKEQEKLFEFVKEQHKGQLRKYTGEPYHNHLFSVAELVNRYESECYEVALCHDLFEDTKCTFTILYNAMIKIGYNPKYSYDVCTYVTELTDVFTKENYPYHNRKARKDFEADRLGKASYIAQTVKYADLIDNTKSILEHDKDFAKIYLYEKKILLFRMIKGNKKLHKLAINSIDKTD